MPIPEHDFQILEHPEGLRLAYGQDNMELTHAVVLRQWTTEPAELLDRLVTAAKEWGEDWLRLETEDQDQTTIDFEPDDALWLFEMLEPAVLAVNEENFGLALTYWHDMRLNRYLAGARVGHAGHSDYQGPEPAKLAFSLVLREPRAGGVFSVTSHAEDLALREGDLVVFPAYEHHEVTPVASGERIALTGWIGGPALV